VVSHDRYTVGKITPEPRHEIGPNDFGPRASIHMNFPKSGTPMTPTHNSSDFKWKDYCPMVFRLPIPSFCYLCNSFLCMFLFLVGHDLIMLPLIVFVFFCALASVGFGFTARLRTVVFSI